MDLDAICSITKSNTRVEWLVRANGSAHRLGKSSVNDLLVRLGLVTSDFLDVLDLVTIFLVLVLTIVLLLVLVLTAIVLVVSFGGLLLVRVLGAILEFLVPHRHTKNGRLFLGLLYGAT